MSAREGVGMARAAEALLSSRGGFPVLLRLPGLAVSGAPGEELGLSTPMFQEVPVGPAVWRRAGSERELLLGAREVAALAGSDGFVAAESLFQRAVGVVYGGKVYAIEGVGPVMAGDVACAYVLKLQAPLPY